MNDKVVLITGARRGIGMSIASEFADSGYIVVGTATGDSGVEKINRMLLDKGNKGMALALDVNDQENISSVFSKINETFSEYPAILFNNAAVTDDDLFVRMNKDKWDNVINTNLSAQYSVIKSAIKPMIRAKWGRIINISSVVAVAGNPGQANYVAAKAGLIGLTKSLAIEYASKTRNITINAVAPGFITTDMTRDLTEEQSDKIMSKIPMSRMGDPAEVAAVVKFLASKESSYITGQTIHVNGGMLMV